jgi:hypothetical protein
VLRPLLVAGKLAQADKTPVNKIANATWRTLEAARNCIIVCLFDHYLLDQHLWIQIPHWLRAVCLISRAWDRTIMRIIPAL